MSEPHSTDKFYVDTLMGEHYHVEGCEVLKRGIYVQLPFSAIQKLLTRHHGEFKPHECVSDLRRRAKK